MPLIMRYLVSKMLSCISECSNTSEYSDTFLEFDTRTTH